MFHYRMKIVPKCSKVKDGNTDIPSPKFNWCFTYNNYDLSYVEQILVPKFQVLCKSGVIQEEVGEQGTRHLQGRVSFYNKQRLTACKKIDVKIRWGEERNDIASVNYCLKPETKTGKEWIWADHSNKKEVIVKYKVDIKLYAWQSELYDILQTKPDDRSIYWVYENEGCKGKTTFQKYVYGELDDVIILSGKGADMKNGVVEYLKVNKKLPKIVLINVPRSSKDFLSYTGIEEVKDMFFYSGKYEGGMISGECPHVMIFANDEPDYTKMSEDRWIIKDINDMII